MPWSDDVPGNIMQISSRWVHDDCVRVAFALLSTGVDVCEYVRPSLGTLKQTSTTVELFRLMDPGTLPSLGPLS